MKTEIMNPDIVCQTGNVNCNNFFKLRNKIDIFIRRMYNEPKVKNEPRGALK